MRHARFFDWLDEATDGPIGRVVKGIVAAGLLLSLAFGIYRSVVDYREELRRANEHALWPKR